MEQHGKFKCEVFLAIFQCRVYVIEKPVVPFSPDVSAHTHVVLQIIHAIQLSSSNLDSCTRYPRL
jgi:hypothetical protein